VDPGLRRDDDLLCVLGVAVSPKTLPVPGLVPGIHAFHCGARCNKDVGGRDKPGHGELGIGTSRPISRCIAIASFVHPLRPSRYLLLLCVLGASVVNQIR